MIVDTSAIIAILRAEPEASAFGSLLGHSPGSVISAANYLEAAIVVDGPRNPILSRQLDELLYGLGIEIAPITAQQALVARTTYRDFGKGSGHPARLNYGDCFAYALAKERRERLLYKGNDFVHTDIESALD